VKRGDVVTVAAAGDYGKPRPAVIVQTGALPAEHASVIVCQITSDGDDAPDFRVVIDPLPGTVCTPDPTSWPTSPLRFGVRESERRSSI
jgi:mRNA-degrading endonuclease toxin of MazEF toxin-antitoxin module